MSGELDAYVGLLGDVKARIAGAQTRAALAANRELLLLYWDIGRLIDTRQDREGWGTGVIPRLAADLARDLPDARGYSERNLGRMLRFSREYPGLGDPAEVLPQPVAKLAEAPEVSARAVAKLPADVAAVLPQLLSLPWGHHILLLERVPELRVRAWYIAAAVTEGWSRDVLGLMIKSAAHARQRAAITNFEARLPPPQSDLAQQTLKNPYVFDFLSLDAGFRERELERGLLAHLERFLLELGVGFAFVGRQYRLTLGEDDFYLDLLFYHLKLRCFVVVDLKVGAFKAEHAGKMNLYLNLVDDALRHPSDQPSIGLILCQDKKQILAEYALRGMERPIGISEYELTRALPTELRSALPTIDAIESELARDGEE